MPTLYVTAPQDDADRIARTLVEDRLAACVNRVDCHSTYRWEGTVHDDPEAILLVKTADGTASAAAERIESIHPYDVPCIERFDEADIHDPFREWIHDAVEQ